MIKRRARLLLGMLLALTGAVSCGRSEQSPERTTAFVHVNVIPMDRERILEGYTVIVRGERIREVGRTGEVNIPSGATIIEGDDKYLVPGLADMHVHLTTTRGLLLYVANGITTVRNMAGRPAHLAWRDSVAAGALLGPTIYTAAPILDGAQPVWPGSAEIQTAADADSVVQAQRQAGYDFIKVYDGLSLAAYQAVIRAARREGLAVAGHVPTAVPVDTAVASGQAIEHLYGFAARVMPDDPRVTTDWSALSSEEAASRREELGAALLAGTLAERDFIDVARLDSLAHAVSSAGVWVTPTLVVFERPVLAGAALAKARREPEMAYVLPQVLRSWPSTESRPDDLPAPLARFREAELHIRQRIVLALHQARSNLLAGTDAPNPLIVPGFSLHRELRLLVESGLTPFEVLETATRKPAEFLGVAGEVGTVQVGARADLLLLEANPLDDVGNLAQLAGVMVRGTWYSEGDLQTRLEELAASYSQDKDRNP